jgi:hypothetical protein
MALSSGTRLGHYDVTALIGEGGMGQVWQATDTQLNRQVALKILPDAFADDPDRLARFQREAQVLASLNHPGIAAIYGIEEAEGTRALVLELVEGPTLADRIAKGPIPVDDALPIATQIAEALEAAHEAGVIHRDLKPANIKVREDGTVKVLDFGLAKAFAPLSPSGEGQGEGDGLSASPTISLTAAATQIGMVIGTAAYMAPEQAKGHVVDKRADIWAYGAVLFEMLTGRRLFAGADAAEMLAAVLVKEPPISQLDADLPWHVRSVVRRCLARDPKQRLRDIGDARRSAAGRRTGGGIAGHGAAAERGEPNHPAGISNLPSPPAGLSDSERGTDDGRHLARWPDAGLRGARPVVSPRARPARLAADSRNRERSRPDVLAGWPLARVRERRWAAAYAGRRRATSDGRGGIGDPRRRLGHERPHRLLGPEQRVACGVGGRRGRGVVDDARGGSGWAQRLRRAPGRPGSAVHHSQRHRRAR